MDGQMSAPAMLRRTNIRRRASMADSQLKSEVHTLQRKYERLEKKEKRIQVSAIVWRTSCFDNSCINNCL